MKIRVISESIDDYRESYEINAKDGPTLSFYDGEAEDNSLSRSFNDCYLIMDLVRLAYAAGKNGEALEIDYGKPDED